MNSWGQGAQMMYRSGSRKPSRTDQRSNPLRSISAVRFNSKTVLGLQGVFIK